jgi:plastocyanin
MRPIRFLPFLLAAAVAVVIGCGGSSGGGSSTNATNGGTTGNTVTVDMPTGTMSFSPVNAQVHAGDTVKWTNSDALPHTIKPDTAVANMDSDPAFPGGMANGQQFTWTVPAGATAGTQYFYHCKFHGTAGNGTALGNGMVGVITVQ